MLSESPLLQTGQWRNHHDPNSRIDIGTNFVKSILFRIEEGSIEWIAKHSSRIRKRDPNQLAAEDYHWLLKKTDTDPDEVAYVATTGEGENVEFRTGHFYSMTTHARGTFFLPPMHVLCWTLVRFMAERSASMNAVKCWRTK